MAIPAPPLTIIAPVVVLVESIIPCTSNTSLTITVDLVLVGVSFDLPNVIVLILGCATLVPIFILEVLLNIFAVVEVV